MIELQTHIVEVTVYPDRARVTRRGTTALEPGTHKVEIPELPLALDPSSARAGGQFTASAGRGGARLLGVDVRKAFYQETPTAQVKELEDQLQTLEDQDKALADQSEALGCLQEDRCEPIRGTLPSGRCYIPQRDGRYVFVAGQGPV